MDFGARNYIKSANIFDGPDPISASFPHLTSINYASLSPVSNIDLHGLQGTRAAIRFEHRAQKVLKGQMSKEEFMAANMGEAQGAIAGASFFIPGPEDLAIGAFLATKAGQALKAGGTRMVKGLRKLFGKGNDVPTLLQDAADAAADAAGDGSGAVHGSKVHKEFKENVIDIDGVTPEVSYRDGRVVKYGTEGSVRPDVVEGNIDKPTNIYDLKTGGAKVRQKDIDKFKRHVPGKPTVKEIKPRSK